MPRRLRYVAFTPLLIIPILESGILGFCTGLKAASLRNLYYQSAGAGEMAPYATKFAFRPKSIDYTL